MENDPRLTPLVRSLPASVPFVGPEAHERARGRPFRARLGANESLFGPSPKAIAAIEAAAPEAWKYGDSESHDLRAALARHHGCAPENILVGEGIDGLLGLTVRLFIGPGDVAVTSTGAYPTFNYHVAGFGGRIEAVPYTADHEDPERLMARARETGAKLVYLTNPDNPMGTWHDAGTIRDAVHAVPDGALLLLDEAYIELAPDSACPALPVDDPRVLRFRTFSKAHGLAGARVGYVIGEAGVISAFHRIRNHFGMSRISQAAALAALQDQEWLGHIRSEVAAARDRIAAIATQNGLTPIPSATNFVAIDCGSDGAFARKVLDGLMARGIFVRMPFVAPQDRCIRISAGRPADLDAFAEELPGALADARKV
ncbi:pyridoxal phosphate-dependent aminotransferase [Ponticoccus sp. SC2-23]|uniref:pyridoxal phosphate-dependent aminotransferase n=1 Tax=Alexandriicola marinus TaxID=2081710 RepID=UPI000FD86737|nr:pyridoxal phosphate-dependent aminotransferase [Alexandriicola marinus]MBM1221635.1 pyridoxal phosphate-dependent aminotransferase [Ponticoccus sp. SC6-9]MBM1226676.1 pyridoxal phosphate-dependent aminotransferase [Ponticoccus sp. SC6-15]MBM1230627.1 pyridoxal phosphate-dependent aminotransferase [Ponticoccus sp. SC6-38]MBM1235150.1 pyridoxal phosphate-dependent aminotransferase [Ponticoccus sp. SC6-45]MBM1239648.1 pyridoxal phosphate-dependent aminotransferase [Ponticoccus sp. SC6-49]MBM1